MHMMKGQAKPELLRKLPSVDELLRRRTLADAVAKEGHAAVTEAARAVLARLRDEIAGGRIGASNLEPALSGIDEAVARELNQSLGPSLRAVVNATGVILHTNLGRAPVSSSAIDHLRE